MKNGINSRHMALAALAAGVLLAGCDRQTPPPQPAPPPPSAEMRVTYNCDNGETVSVRYFPQQGIGVLTRGGQNVELQQEVTPGGFIYSAPPATKLTVQQDRLRMSMMIGAMAVTQCIAV